MTPTRLRAYVLIVMRDILIPAAGVYLTIYLARSGQLKEWHAPFLATMIGVPLVAR